MDLEDAFDLECFNLTRAESWGAKFTDEEVLFIRKSRDNGASYKEIAEALSAVGVVESLTSAPYRSIKDIVRARSYLHVTIDGGIGVRSEGGRARALTPEQKETIRGAYADGDLSLADLAKEYGVSKKTIHRAVTEKK